LKEYRLGEKMPIECNYLKIHRKEEKLIKFKKREI